MSFIELPGVGDVKEPRAAPEGTYDLCVVNAKMTEKEGKQSIMTVLEIEGHEDDNYANVFHYVALPNSEDDENKASTKLLFARRFFEQFGIEYDNGVELEQFVGARAEGRLTQDTWNNAVRNNLQVDRLPAEE